MRRSRTTTLAGAALVVTVSACGGTTDATGDSLPLRNPPRIVYGPVPPLEPGDAIALRDDATCVLQHGDGRPSEPLAACPEQLASRGTLHRWPDGRCVVMEAVDCPPPSVATCNPPPPQPVPCPPGSPEVQRPPQPTMNPPPP